MRTSVALTVTAILGITLATAEPAAAAVKKETNIPAQGLGAALQTLATARDFQILYRSELVGDARTSGAVGELTASEALTRLLSGTGLTYEYLDDKTITIVPEDRTVPRARPSSAHDEARTEGGAPQIVEANGGVWSRFRLAQSGTSPGTGEAGARREGQGNESGKAASDETNSGLDSDKSPASLQEIVVTGTHIRGVKKSLSPSIVLNRDDIESSGFSTSEALFKSLPENFSDVSADAALATDGTSRLAQQNFDRASGINLRGLGANSTLTLLDGRRLAGSDGGRVVDVSLLPLQIIERVDIVTGGLSAIYGSDAVAGVANIVTRHDYEGVEGRSSYRLPGDGGGEQFQAGILAGQYLGRVHAVGAYQYQRSSPFDVVNAGLIISPTPSGETQLQSELLPHSTQHSGFLSGELDPASWLHVSATGLASVRDADARQRSIQSGAVNETYALNGWRSELYSAELALTASLGGDWDLNVDGSTSSSHNTASNRAFADYGAFSFTTASDRDDKFTVHGASAVLSGPVHLFENLTSQVAIGGEFRTESYDSNQVASGVPTNRDVSRSVSAAFGEIYLPVPLNDAGQRLEFSIGARYDDYEDFGSTFNTQAGIALEVSSDLRIRTTYSESFRAPALVETGETTFGQIVTESDPGSTPKPVLVWFGDNPNLQPEQSRAWTFGIEYAPSFLPGSRVSLSYFDIDYKDRVDVPAFGFDAFSALSREDRYPGLLTRSPTQSEITDILAAIGPSRLFNLTATPFDPNTQQILGAFPNLVLLDNRNNNIAINQVRGLDLIFGVTRQTPLGALNLDANASYYLNSDKSITATSPAISQIDEVGKPVGFRLRGSIGLRGRDLSGALHVNYFDSYDNQFTSPTGRVSSWTTIDANFGLNLGHILSGMSEGLTATLSINNLLDEAPPKFLQSATGFRYDPVNGNPFGRYVTVGLGVKW